VEGKRYVAYLLNYEGEPDVELEILSISCERDCIYESILTGTVNGITNGIIKAYQTPYIGVPLPVATSVIRNGTFEIKTNAMPTNMEYIFVAVKIN